MKGMIFAAGLGTRLRPLTDHCPKALIEVGGMTMLERTIRRMVDAGVTEITVNIHHHAQMIREYLAQNANFGAKISLSDESDELLDTGGGLAKALELIGTEDDVLVCNADIFTDFDIAEMAEAHEKSGADVTLLCQDRETARKLLFDEEGKMVGWTNLSTGEIRTPYPTLGETSALAFGGIHILAPSALEMLKEKRSDGKFSITPFYIETCNELCIKAFQQIRDYVWVDIGRPESLNRARSIAEESRPTPAQGC